MKNQNMINIPRKTLHTNFYIQKYNDKNNFIPKNILMHNPQRDKALSTSKKEVRNNGIII
jgi:hypothetical protein